MKVLMVESNLDSGGIGSVVMTLYRSLIRQNIRCDLVYYTGNPPSEEIRKEIYANGSKLFCINSVSQGPIKYIRNVKKICKRNEYDVIHIHTCLLIWMAALGAKLAGVPVRIGHAHGAKFLNYSKKVLFFFEPFGRWLNRKFCTNFITCSEKSGIYTFGREAIFIPNYVMRDFMKIPSDGECKQIRHEINLSSSKYLFMYTGCLDGVKNAIFLPSVIAKMRERGIDVSLVLVGHTENKRKFKDEIVRLDMNEYVHLLGFRRDCRRIIHGCDCFISASTTEGMSVSMVEAQMAGKLCIVSACIPLESDIEIGLFKQIEGFDADHWAIQIEALLMNSKNKKYTRESLEEKLNDSQFMEDAVIRKLIQIYSRDFGGD